MKSTAYEQFFHEKIPLSQAVCLLVVPNEFERQKMVQQLISSFQEKTAYSLVRFSSQNAKVEEWILSLNSPSLFGGEPLIVVEDLHQLKKKDVEQLSLFFEKSSFGGIAIFAAAEKKEISSFYSFCEKKGFLLDLSQEKPWEKEKRLKRYILQTAKKEKVDFPPSLIDFFFEKMGGEIEQLDSELTKLFTYVGEKKSIEERDIEKISAVSHQENFWQLAEKMIWSEELYSLSLEEIATDSHSFHLFVSALRYQLQVGLKLSSSPDIQIEQFVPKLYPKLFEKRKKASVEKGAEFFKTLLLELFKIDLLSKNQMTAFSALMGQFKAKMIYLLDYEQ